MYGGIDGIRDNNMLNSALQSPFQTWGGKDLYETLEEKAAHLCYSIVKNHPMLDGNKRLGAFSLVSFLELNKYLLLSSADDLIDLIYGIANNSLTIDDLISWIKSHKKEKMNLF